VGGEKRGTFRMPIDTSSLTGYFSLEKRKPSEDGDGYISPPLSARRPKNVNGTMKRIAIIGITVLTILYLCGFRIPGYARNRNQVVMILAANLGGGNLLSNGLSQVYLT
jgi:hypothetical protein